MKNAIVQLTLVLVGITGVHAVKLLQTSPLDAHAHPITSAEKVWANHGKDSLRMIGVYVKAMDEQ